MGKTNIFKSRHDKDGGYSFVRRWMNRLIDNGLRSVSIPVASWTVPNRLSDGKGSLTIYRDGIVKDFKANKKKPVGHFDKRDCLKDY